MIILEILGITFEIFESLGILRILGILGIILEILGILGMFRIWGTVEMLKTLGNILEILEKWIWEFFKIGWKWWKSGTYSL